MKQNDKSQNTTYCAQDQTKAKYTDKLTAINKFGTKKYRLLNRYFYNVGLL
jgi:hypothetical protein